jgi:hypothetical protein
LVPATKGCIPKAPEGGHSNHAGVLPEVTAVAVPEEPPEVARVEDVGLAPPSALDPVPAAPAVDAAVAVDPVAEAPVAAADAGGTKVTGLPDAAEGKAAPAPRVTTPRCVTLPGVVAVCAETGRATATENSNA